MIHLWLTDQSKALVFLFPTWKKVWICFSKIMWKREKLNFNWWNLFCQFLTKFLKICFKNFFMSKKKIRVFDWWVSSLSVLQFYNKPIKQFWNWDFFFLFVIEKFSDGARRGGYAFNARQKKHNKTKQLPIVGSLVGRWVGSSVGALDLALVDSLDLELDFLLVDVLDLELADKLDLKLKQVTK